MKQWFNRSLRNRLIVAFLTVGFVPMSVFLIYMVFLSQNKIVQKSIQEEQEQITRTQQIIKMHLYSLDKEIGFLSSLEVMDDIVSEDLDKRITTILEKKAKDISLNVVLYILDKDNRLIASSQNDFKPFFFPKKTRGYTLIGKNLYFFRQVSASYDPKIKLGYLVMRYNLDNLKLFLPTTESTHTFLIEKNNVKNVAQTIPCKIDPNKSIVITDEHLIVYKELNGYLKGWYLVYAVNKNVALAFLYDFLRFMLYMVPFLLAIIVIAAWMLSKNITTPIVALTRLTDRITRTKNFDSQIEIYSSDEIGRLSHSFNLMLSMTDKALKELQKENEMRLHRFIHLIQIFNTIMKTQTTQECIITSVQKLKELSKEKEIVFSQVTAQECIPLEITNYETGKKELYGSLCIENATDLDENERQFYYSIAQMISLQLDRIVLVDKTMAASKAKSAFISNMSHELRTPLNAIIGFTQYMLAYEELNEEQSEIVENIESSAQYLLSMINDILDMAKIEAGKMQAHIEEVTIVSIIKDVMTMLKPLIEEKGLQSQLNIALEEDTIVHTDAKMYKQICINMLSNSIKFTAKGSIEVSLYSKEEKIFFEVKDTGIGISKENMEKLFSDFTQVENVMQKQHKGTGLGLSLSKKMARILHGDLELVSEGEGKGTKAVFWIPL